MLTPVLGKGTNAQFDVALFLMVQTCFIMWVAAVGYAVWSIQNSRRDAHYRGMVLSFAVMLTPLTQRGIHICLVPIVMIFCSLILGWDRWESGEEMISFEGFGRAGQAVLPVTAWGGASNQHLDGKEVVS